MKNSTRIYTFLVLVILTLTSCNGGGGSGGSDTPNNDGPKNVSMKINWTPPSERVDKSRLYPHEIGGYEILYRKTGQNDWSSIVVYDDQSWVLDEYELKNLTAGTYEVKMATFDIDGLFSEYSQIVTVDKN